MALLPDAEVDLAVRTGGEPVAHQGREPPRLQEQRQHDHDDEPGESGQAAAHDSGARHRHPTAAAAAARSTPTTRDRPTAPRRHGRETCREHPLRRTQETSR